MNTNDEFLYDVVLRAGPSAREMNVSIDELFSLASCVEKITARGGSVIGNALKTIFQRIKQEETIATLNEMNVKIDNSLSGIEILANLADAYDTLSEKQRFSLAEKVGGIFQITILKAAFSSFKIIGE